MRLGDLLTNIALIGGVVLALYGLWLIFAPAAFIAAGLAIAWGASAIDRGRS